MYYPNTLFELNHKSLARQKRSLICKNSLKMAHPHCGKLSINFDSSLKFLYLTSDVQNSFFSTSDLDKRDLHLYYAYSVICKLSIPNSKDESHLFFGSGPAINLYIYCFIRIGTPTLQTKTLRDYRIIYFHQIFCAILTLCMIK